MHQDLFLHVLRDDPLDGVGAAVAGVELMNRGKRPKIKITITDRRGKMGCHRGHHVGEVFDYDEDRGKIAPDRHRYAPCAAAVRQRPERPARRRAAT